MGMLRFTLALASLLLTVHGYRKGVAVDAKSMQDSSAQQRIAINASDAERVGGIVGMDAPVESAKALVKDTSVRVLFTEMEKDKMLRGMVLGPHMAYKKIWVVVGLFSTTDKTLLMTLEGIPTQSIESWGNADFPWPDDSIKELDVVVRKVRLESLEKGLEPSEATVKNCEAEVLYRVTVERPPSSHVHAVVCGPHPLIYKQEGLIANERTIENYEGVLQGVVTESTKKVIIHPSWSSYFPHELPWEPPHEAPWELPRACACVYVQNLLETPIVAGLYREGDESRISTLGSFATVPVTRSIPVKKRDNSGGFYFIEEPAEGTRLLWPSGVSEEDQLQLALFDRWGLGRKLIESAPIKFQKHHLVHRYNL